MSRTNHHRRSYDRWNLIEVEVYYGKRWTPYRGQFFEEDRRVGMETWDLRFYAGCRRTPEVVHRELHFHGRYPWRFHHGPGNAGPAAAKQEAKFRADARRYTDEARGVWNAGGDVDELREPDRRPWSIEWDLW